MQPPPPSVDPDEDLDNVLAGVRARTLTGLRPLLIATVPLSAGFAVFELARGSGTGWVVAQALLACGGSAGALLARSVRVRAGGLGVAVTGLALTALFHYGPLIGTGVMSAASVLCWTYFFGGRTAALVIALHVAAVIVAALLSLGGWRPPRFGSVEVADWVRLLASGGIPLAGIAYAFHRVSGAMREALAGERRAQSEQRRAEAERERALESATKAQRLETAGHLASGVAHDFNNTLAVIQATFEAIPGAKGPELDSLVDEGLAAVRNATTTTRQMLGLARRNTEEIGVSLPHQVLERLVRATQRLLPATVHLELDARPCPHVPLSEAALEQALLNLVVNAKDAMNGRGVVRIACTEAAGGVSILVEDDGVGMDAEVRARIFEPFFTTKGRDHGTGLGLAMVWNIVHRAGGTIDVDSAPGRGTRIVLQLPKTDPGATSDEVAPARAPVESTEARSALVVEDDSMVRRTLERRLRRSGWDVTGAASLAEARAHLLDERFELLVTDGVLGDGSAVDVIAAFRTRHPDRPIVLCTGYLDESELLAGIEQHALVLLRKPFSTNDFNRALELALSSGGSAKPSAPC